MAASRDVRVHLIPELVRAESLSGSVAVVIDARTRRHVHALVLLRRRAPCGMRKHAPSPTYAWAECCFVGERDGCRCRPTWAPRPPPLRPRQHDQSRHHQRHRALLKAASAERTLVAGFVNFSAVCEQLRHDVRPVDILCAGSRGEVALEAYRIAGRRLRRFSCERWRRAERQRPLAWIASRTIARGVARRPKSARRPGYTSLPMTTSAVRPRSIASPWPRR